ncbi:glycosyltransferase family 4 protein [Tetragenococcus koreensis]|uniref:glycosyltransferase family 4 protein n=1 Tax=Tetragenococcus koreensis TaxID=290335 RepID=UPI000F4FFF20|nr:glycosyltransferase family 4 protein [Tetragenococcus koreensis]AYW46465.1 glycosyltransferase family 1 protein [Tetragenococcus koreensis]GEN91997.1 glycosyl transferase [Tetragenococcus koreensis]
MAKKVLFLVNHDVVIYNFRRELVEHLLSENYQVIISSPYGERIDQLIEMGCVYDEVKIERHSTNPLDDMKLFLYYKKIMKKYEPDVVLTYTIKPNVYGAMAAKIAKIPCIANITGLGTALEKKGVMQKITLTLYKIAFSKISKVFFQNTENLEFFREHGIATKRHRLLPGSGVNLNHFQLMDYPPDDVVKFVFVSRIMKEKGIDQYLGMAEYIKQKYPNVEFHILGFCEDSYEKVLKKMQQRNIIKYHGMQSDVRNFHKFSHCTIHPTYYPEGMSNVLLESAACGRPIITTNRSGCREIIDDEVNGYIVEQEDTNDLIEKVEKFLSLNFEEKKAMGLAGRKKVEREFDRKIIVDAYQEEINVILENN